MKKIAIIGATGNMGSNIARNLAKAEHQLYLTGREEDKLSTLKTALDNLGSTQVRTFSSPKEAAKEAEIIILAVWHAAQAEVAQEIRDCAKGKIVVSIANPLNDTYDGLTTDCNTSSAEELAQLLPESKVVKAFNTTFAGAFSQTSIDSKQVDCFVAGDDAEAVNTIQALVADAGFNPLVAGKLNASRTLENMTVMLIGLSQRYGYNWLAGWKVLNNAAKMVI